MSSRREKARRIALIVSERVREVTSPGLGAWGPAWALVSEQSDAFIDALYVWQTGGAPDDLEAVEVAAEALVDTWRAADKRFRESDAPSLAAT